MACWGGRGHPRNAGGTATAPKRRRALRPPPQHAIGRTAVGRSKLSQPQHLIALRERTAPIEPSVDHVAPKVERRARARQRGAQPVGIVDPRLDFELVRRRGRELAHAKMASSTAAVSARVSNAYVAPVARRAATS